MARQEALGEEALREFDAFFEVWYPHLLRYVCRLAVSRAAAEDIVQEIFLDLYKALGSGKSIEFPKAWTLCVARRKCAELRSRPFNLEDRHASLDLLANTGENPAAALNSNLDLQRLRGFLSVLTEREEEVLLLRLQAMKFREIADSLGIGTSSVNTLLIRALDRLQQAFGVRAATTIAARRRHES